MGCVVLITFSQRGGNFSKGKVYLKGALIPAFMVVPGKEKKHSPG